LGSSKKLDLDNEIDLESDMDLDSMDDLDAIDDVDLNLDEEQPGNQVLTIHFQTCKNDLFCYGKPKQN